MDTATTTSRGSMVACFTLLTLALLLRGFLLVATPLGQTVASRIEGLNDEPAHINYVRYLAEQRAFPIQTHHYREPGAFARGDFEYYQPPLYYLVCAPLYAAVGERNGLYVCRLVSFVCGLLSLVVIGRIFGLLGCPPSCGLLGVLFVALLPTHAYFSSLASNDSLSWLIALLISHEMLVLVDRGRGTAEPPPIGLSVRLGFLLAAGMLTKGSIGIFPPVLVLVYWFVASGPRRVRAFSHALIPLGLMLLIAGPWYWRNQVLYGSVTALDVGFGPVEPGLGSAAGFAHILKATVRYFWFPMQHVSGSAASSAIRQIGAVILPLHAAAAVVFLRGPGGAGTRNLTMALILCIALVAQVTLGMSWTDVEGRFLFPALAPIAYFMVAPVFAFAARWKGGERLAWIYIVLVAAHPWALLAFA